jgi:hypothetical protein
LNAEAAEKNSWDFSACSASSALKTSFFSEAEEVAADGNGLGSGLADVEIVGIPLKIA